jgi:enoyl-[acyl-carrier protein] reductase I
MMAFDRIYPLDAAWDTLDEVPEDIRQNRRYQDAGDFTVHGLAASLAVDVGEGGLDILVHSLANGPEVRSRLLDTSRQGYLTAVSVSAYSMVSMLKRLGPLMRRGGSTLSLTYMASERAIPVYGGGMSSAKAALESDTRMLAFEAGREWGIRVNTISAGPYASRAASAIGVVDQLVVFCAANSPIPEALTAMEVGHAAAFLCSDLASGITGTTLYVDKGYHAMGMAVAGPVPKRES